MSMAVPRHALPVQNKSVNVVCVGSVMAGGDDDSTSP